MSRFSVLSLKSADCNEPHDGEYIGSGLFPGDDESSYPGDQVLLAESIAQCTVVHNAYTAVEYGGDLPYELGVDYPDQRDWDVLSHRQVACFVVSGDGTRLAASVKG